MQEQLQALVQPQALDATRDFVAFHIKWLLILD
jgi:hypothetical protein